MATQKQQKAVKNLVENGGNVTKAMQKAGYSTKTAHTPSKLTNSQGYKDILAQYGLTAQMVVEALVFDIQAKPTVRAREITIAVELLGLKKSEPVSTPPNYGVGFLSSPSIRALVQDLEAKIKDEIRNSIIN